MAKAEVLQGTSDSLLPPVQFLQHRLSEIHYRKQNPPVRLEKVTGFARPANPILTD